MVRHVARSSAVIALIAALCTAVGLVGSPAAASLSGGSGRVSGGDGHTCALTATGGVSCWGANTRGQLGDGTLVGRSIPGPVPALAGITVTEVTAGWAHTCVLTDRAGAKCWGYNADGQLGIGSTGSPVPTPVDVTGLLSGVVAISAGAFHTCALTDAGGVKCWGSNNHGQLGDGTTTARTAPVDVVGLESGVAAISAGDGATCAITTTGGLKCWGDNQGGGLGDGTTTDRSTPVDVTGLSTGVASVDNGGTDGFGSRTCAVTSAGALKCWGSNNQGQLGDGTTTPRTTPTDVVGLGADVAQVSVGTSFTCARTTTGAASCWGQYALGAGIPGAEVQTTPLAVTGLSSGVRELGTGGYHACAFDTGGGLQCWGGIASGQLGIGLTSGTWGRLPHPVSGSFERPECPTLIPEEHTDFTATDGYAVGSVFTFTADPGFVLVDPDTVTCQPDLTFDAAPPTAGSTGTVTISPDTGLVGGDTVEVTLSGFAPDTEVGWCYAVAQDPASESNCAEIVLGTTDGTGVLTSDLRLDRFIWVNGLSRWVDCATEACAIGAGAIADLAATVTSTGVDLTVPPPPTVRGAISLDPVRVGSAAEDVTVTGSGFRPGALVEVFQCEASPTDPSACNEAAARVTTDAAGGFSTTVDIADTVTPAGGTTTDCFDSTSSCVIAAAEAPDFPGTVAVATLEESGPVPTVLPGIGTVVEGTGGTSTLSIAVTLSNPWHEPVEIPWTTIFSSSWDEVLRADPDVDYVPSAGTVTLAPFQTAATVEIPIVADADPEGDEMIVVSFHKPTNAFIGGFWGLGFGIVLDDDNPA